MCVECERGVWQHGGRMFKVFVYIMFQGICVLSDTRAGVCFPHNVC